MLDSRALELADIYNPTLARIAAIAVFRVVGFFYTQTTLTVIYK